MSQPKIYSIKRQLILYTTVFCLGLGCVFMYAAYRIALEEITEILDQQMKNLAEHVELSNPKMISSQFDPHHQYKEEDLFIDVWSDQHPSKHDFILEKQMKSGFYQVQDAQGKWKAYIIPLQDRQIQISQQLSVRKMVALELAGNMFVPYLLFIPLVLLGFNWIIRKHLRPLDEFETELSQRDPNDLKAIQIANLPVEILPSIDEINRLFQRIAEAQALQRQFVMDAAHELRTPLTALNLQTKILLNEFPHHPGLNKMLLGLGRVQHLVAQLLSLAQQESTLEHSESKATIYLHQTCIACIEQLIDLAIKNDIDLGVDQQEEIQLNLYPSALYSIIYNLIDNAIKYTPPQGVINVSVYRDADEAVIQVEDSGPGISDEQKQHILKRFYKGDNDKVGSGLGLAIVEQASQRLNATVVFAQSPKLGGLQVQLRLKLLG